MWSRQEVITPSYKQLFDLSVKLSKINDELEGNIIEFHNHVNVVESENDKISDEKMWFDDKR